MLAPVIAERGACFFQHQSVNALCHSLGADPNDFTKLFSGLFAGCVTALCTQWMHNTCLVAGAMAEMGERPTLMLTSHALAKAWKQLGFQIFYFNYTRRVGFIATSCAVLNVLKPLDLT